MAEYSKIDCVILAVRPKSVLIDAGSVTTWIGRSCIHGADEIRLDALDEGDEVELRIFTWLCDKEGLL